MGIGIGDRAPRFALKDGDDKTIELDALLAKGPVVIFFYPKDETPGCTKEACTFRDNFTAFEGLGAAVVGISSDSTESHRRFSGKFGFPFPLLSDPGGATRKAFGVPKTLGLLDGRSTYVLDKEGVVRGVFHSQLQVTKHVDEAVAAVRALPKA